MRLNDNLDDIKTIKDIELYLCSSLDTFPDEANKHYVQW
jgi:hypothetical protein